MAEMGGATPATTTRSCGRVVIGPLRQVDAFGYARRLPRNAEPSSERTREQLDVSAMGQGGQGAFDDFAVVPPDTGIVLPGHLEYLAR